VQAAVATKVADAVLGEVVKSVLGKIVGAGKNSIQTLYQALSERFPNRRIQMSIETPNGVDYPIGPDDAADAVPKLRTISLKSGQVTTPNSASTMRLSGERRRNILLHFALQSARIS
jgi:hypothetical protein